MGLILAALVDTWHDGAASLLLIHVRGRRAYVYRAEFHVCSSRWSGATRVFSHDFDDILEGRSMSFVPRLVACRGRIRYAAGAAELELLAGQSCNSQPWSVAL